MEREWITCSGKLKLQVPRHRNLPFKTLLFENYKRSETALITTMAEMVANGVATRKIKGIRSKSVNVFSNTDSLLRMMGSLLIELNDNLQLKKIIFKPENYESLLRSDIPEQLKAIAE